MSTHTQSKFSAAQNMEMQMVNGLTGMCSAVGDHAVAAFQLFFRGDLGDHLKDPGDHSAVFGGHTVDGRNVNLGDHQDMGGCLGRDVPEGIHQFIFVNLGGRDITLNDLTEQTIRLSSYLLLKS